MLVVHTAIPRQKFKYIKFITVDFTFYFFGVKLYPDDGLQKYLNYLVRAGLLPANGLQKYLSYLVCFQLLMSTSVQLEVEYKALNYLPRLIF